MLASQELQRYHRYCLPYLNKPYQERVEAIEHLFASASSALPDAGAVDGFADSRNGSTNSPEFSLERRENFGCRFHRNEEDSKGTRSYSPYTQQAPGPGSDMASHCSFSSTSPDANGHKICTSDQESAAEANFQFASNETPLQLDGVAGPPKRGRRRIRDASKIAGNRVALM